jgi:NAD(P)-dependent dehydrogenase (short-subunit alcohol dehydrogenase family)
MKTLKGKVAAITGAGSGIGRALALGLAAERCQLAISDINESELRETEQLIRNQANVSVHIVDVADRDQVYRYADDVVAKHGGVDMIINNAGVVLADTVEGTSYDDFQWIMGINLWGVIYGTKAFLPYLQRRPEGHIVNISSVNGITPMPYGCAYNATKFAIRGFTETLAQELRGTSIKASVVHPGGIRTNIARKARYYRHVNPSHDRQEFISVFEKNAMTTAEKAARIIISGIKSDKVRIIVGPDARLCDLMTRTFPVVTLWLVDSIVHKIPKLQKS